MSIPGDTPNPYGPPQPPPQPPLPPQQNAQPQPPSQQSAPPPGSYGQPPQPSPHAPAYAQPTMPGVPAVSAMPGGQQPGGGYGPYGAPPPPPGGGAGGGGGKGWLWALGGAVVASAVWAGVVFATGGFDGEPKADLAGYGYRSNLCASTDLEAIKDAGYEQKDTSSSTNPRHSASRDPALDSMTCQIDFEPSDASSSDYSSSWLSTTAGLHRKTDPEPEFEAQYRSYEDQRTSSYTYKVSPVDDLGDEAYVVTQENTGSSDTGAYVILGVREGWMTYQSTWSEYVSSSSSADPMTTSEATEMLEKSARATLEKLKNQG
ncbi:hypothetical protein ACH4TX_16910 [Streptomyces sp. NPDC021098]|uniref:hypothetical protein n=1 Tax=unclassified Streptomyces TaxID=2593676 RepID=UPI0037AD0537